MHFGQKRCRRQIIVLILRIVVCDSFFFKMKSFSRKLIFFIGTLQSGGAERVVSEISAMYADHFEEVVILTYYDAPVFYSIDTRVRIECIERITGTDNKLKNALWLRRFVKREKPDVFLSFLMPFNMMAIASLLFSQTKIVVCERQDPSDVKTPLLRIIRNFLYHFCTRIEVQTLKAKNYFSRSLQKKITIIPNPNHIKLEEREYALNSTKERKVAIVGRLIPLKNHKMLINAFSRVINIHADYHLDIYGDGEMYKALDNQIRQLGVTESVKLHGRTDNVPEALASARIFVLCSNVEGMPNALMEAMALGIPCIATDVSGVRDIIDDGENGFIIPVGNQKALEDRLMQLMDSEYLQDCFSRKSISVMEKFDKRRIFEQWMNLVTFEKD